MYKCGDSNTQKHRKLLMISSENKGSKQSSLKNKRSLRIKFGLTIYDKLLYFQSLHCLGWETILRTCPFILESCFLFYFLN